MILNCRNNINYLNCTETKNNNIKLNIMKALINKFNKLTTAELTALQNKKTTKPTEKAAIKTILTQRSKSESAKKETPVKKMTPKKTPAKKTAAKKSTPAKKPATKKVAAKPKKPGVIQTIYDLIDKKGPITNTKILDGLAKAFPDRDREAMNRTLKIQIMSSNRPVRMERDRKVTFDVKLNEKTKVKTFSIKKK